ncbi:MAG: nicotinate-nucleotide--dimethylbenzimidazole phosphoribosyltransferase [Christensenellales bacterium]|jgi:nicotinate-nucleotide--dimethylbenzimidazole phosphoribosyltransferase
MRKWDERAHLRAKEKWDAVAKPLSSLGRLERAISQIAGIQGTEDIRLKPRCVLVFCSDHGVVAQGVTQSDSSVTALVAKTVCEGTSNVNLMARAADADVFAIDMGMAEDVHDPRLIVKKRAHGTRDITFFPAMAREDALFAINCGRALVGEMRDRGYRLIATGEMGIGNTTSAAAIACALLGEEPEDMAGRGSGLSDEGLRRKIRAIQTALTLHAPEKGDPVGILAKLGGFEIAGMVGAFLGGMEYGVPTVADGVISCVSALLAQRIRPECKDFMLASHMSREPAARKIMDALNLAPVIDAEMALGEGTGAVMLFPLLDMAYAVYSGAHTFSGIGLDAYTPQGGAK